MPSLLLSCQLVIAGLSLATTSCLIPTSNPSENTPEEAAEDGDELLDAEIATVGWDRLSQGPVVLLRVLEPAQVVPIWVGMAEARAIAAALQDVEFPRPMTHDLMVNLLTKLDAKLEEVIIHDLRDGVYYGLLKLQLKEEEEPRLMDTRPSDGLALALRTGAAIRLARKILRDQPEFNFLPPEVGDQVVRSAGLTVVAVTEALRDEFELPEREGVVVVEAGEPAERLGLKRGDLIVKVNDVVPAQPVDFLRAVVATPLGEPLRLTYWREGKEVKVEVPLGVEDRLLREESVPTQRV